MNQNVSGGLQINACAGCRARRASDQLQRGFRAVAYSGEICYNNKKQNLLTDSALLIAIAMQLIYNLYIFSQPLLEPHIFRLSMDKNRSLAINRQM